MTGTISTKVPARLDRLPWSRWHWCVVLFFASAGCQLGVPHGQRGLPDGTRALAIAFFYPLGTAAGGISGPLIFSSLVSTGKVSDTVVAFSIGATLMILGGVAELFLGVKAERQSLESIAQPLTAEDAKTHGRGRARAGELQMA